MKNFIFSAIAFTLCVPVIGHAQLAVPVTAVGAGAASAAGYSGGLETNDSIQKLNEAFTGYTVDDENHSLRTLLTGNPASNLAKGLLHPALSGNEVDPNNDTIAKTLDKESACDLRHIADTNKGVPQDGGAWDYLIKNGAFLPKGSDPSNMSDADFADQSAKSSDFSGVMVNDSRGLSCLMQEVVEWQKLSINLQIHQLLRNEIAAAQAKNVAAHLKGMNSAATTRQSQSANTLETRDENGEVIESESFPSWTDPGEYACELIKRRAKTMADSVMKSSDPYRFRTAQAILKEQDAQCNDLAHYQESVGNQLIDQNDPDSGTFATQQDVSDYFNGNSSKAKRDPITAFSQALDDRNNPRGASNDAVAQLRAMADGIREKIATRYQANGGFLSTEKCNSASANCDPDDLKIITPGSVQNRAVQDAVMSFNDQLDNTDSASGLATLNTDAATADILGQGITGFDPSNYENQPPIYQYVREFYNGIRGGYYDIQPGTTDWATGAMLSIYDNVVTDPHMFREADEADYTDSSQIQKPQ